MASEQRRVERVHIVLAPEAVQHRHDALARIRFRAQRQPGHQRAWIAVARQLQPLAAVVGQAGRLQAVVEEGSEPVAQARFDREGGGEFDVVRDPRDVAVQLGQALRHFEGEQPAAVRGFQGDLVADRLAADRQRRRRGGGRQARREARGAGAGQGAGPGAPVVVAQHRAAPVELLLGRHGTVEAHAEGRLAGLRQVRHRARRHCLGHSRARAVGVARHAPQRALDAREQEEQRQRQRRRQAQDAGAHQEALAQRRQRAAELEAHLGRQQRQHRGRHQQRRADALLVEEVGQHQEEAQEDHHEQVAPRVHLEHLEGHQQHQHRHPGVAPEQGLVAVGDPRHGERRQRQQQHGGGHALALQRDRRPPQQGQGAQQGHPQRQVGRVRRQHQQGAGEQQQGVGFVARQGIEACQQGLHRAPPPYRASARRQAAAWAAPLAAG